MNCWKCSLWYSLVASQLLYIRLHECCKQLKRPVAVIPQCSYPETRSLETAGMSSFFLSLFFASNFLSVGFTLFLYVFLYFLSVRSWHVQAEPHSTLPLLPIPFSHAHSCGGREPIPALCTQTWQSVTDTEANANNGSNACGKMRKQRGAVRHPPAFCSLLLPHIHISFHI